MSTPLPTGRLAQLAHELCTKYPAEQSVSALTNEAIALLRAAGHAPTRKSTAYAIRLELRRLGRPLDSTPTKRLPIKASDQESREAATLQLIVAQIEEQEKQLNQLRQQEAVQHSVAAPTPVVVPILGTDSTPEQQEEAGPWCVVDDHYSWSSTQGSFYRAVADVDEMFFCYSRHGLNMSQAQMVQDFGLSLWEWNTLKARLLLQKNSNVFSPYTVSVAAPAELEQMMREKMSRRYEKLGPLIERAHRDAAVKQLNKVMGQLSQREARLQRLAMELGDLLPSLKYRYVAIAPQMPSGPEHLVFTLADPHVGAQVKKLLNAPRYDRTVLFQYADQLAAKVNARGAKNVYLAGLGDYIESFAGMNHPNTWLQLDAELTRAGAIRGALEFFSYLIERIYNVREIWGVSGNHDRTSNDKKEDSRGEAAELLFMFLQERFGEFIQVHYRYDLLVRVVDNICYMLGHSHLAMLCNEKKALETIARHRVPGYYCVLLSAHLHTRIVKLDADDCRWVFAPSVFTGNNYSSDGGLSSLAGFLTLENNGFNYPRIIDEPLSVQEFTPARLAA